MATAASAWGVLLRDVRWLVSVAFFVLTLRPRSKNHQAPPVSAPATPRIKERDTFGATFRRGQPAVRWTLRDGPRFGFWLFGEGQSPQLGDFKCDRICRSNDGTSSGVERPRLGLTRSLEISATVFGRLLPLVSLEPVARSYSDCV